VVTHQVLNRSAWADSILEIFVSNPSGRACAKNAMLTGLAHSATSNQSVRDAVAKINLNVDGKAHSIDADADMPLLYALRDDLGLKNPRFGCGLAQCGACTVLVDGVPTRSCVTPVDSLAGRKVTTLAGIQKDGKPHKVQQAFIDEQVPQCGYCLNGWVMTSVALLESNPKPNDAQIREALTGLKCRCGTHISMLRAIKRAAQA
jgi:aerobic-type carbon monoxide dehydrogenase small subunit (CoxS/CutS family)